VAETHETEERPDAVAPDGTVIPGAATQVDPFHVSVTAVPVVPSLPTPMQNVMPTQDTETSWASTDEDDGLATVVHADPSHRSVRTPPPVFPFWVPTPTQKVDVVHEIDMNPLVGPPGAAAALVQLVALTVGAVVSAPTGAGASKAPVSGATTMLAASARDFIRNTSSSRS
jgi:hypothetical protein